MLLLFSTAQDKNTQTRIKKKKEEGTLDVIKIYNVFASKDTKDRVKKQSQKGRDYLPVICLVGA